MDGYHVRSTLRFGFTSSYSVMAIRISSRILDDDEIASIILAFPLVGIG